MPNKRQQLRQRLTDFALDIIDLVKALSDDPQQALLLEQLMRSGTCLGAKYAYACHSPSLGWFAHELARVEVLAAETLCWLELASQRGLASPEKIAPLLAECQALLSLISRSLQAAERRKHL